MKTKRTVLIAMVAIAMAILGTLGNFWGEQRVQALASVPAAVATPPPPTMVNHPGDGYATIQAAVNAAGCGGTVLLAAGTYNERVLISCGARLIGAGVG